MAFLLKWDQTGERFYETGVDHGVLYVYNSELDAQTNGTNYYNGVVWNGLTAVTESPSGAESNPIYADNIKYLDLRSAEEFGCTIEAYTYPDQFAECDGSASVATGVLATQQKRKKFGFTYRTKIGSDEDADAGYKLNLVYGATASPSEKSYQTVNDSPEAITFSWEAATEPIVMDGTDLKPIAHLVIDSTKANATKLAALEQMLYGTPAASAGGDPTPARLPLPAQVIEMMTTGSGDESESE